MGRSTPSSADAVLLMIDAAGSRDRDDAITATALPDGTGWEVAVHVAAVADVVPIGSRADQQAFLRGETRYHRTRTVPMLGPTAEHAATLTEHADRTTLCIRAICDRRGNWDEVTITRELVPAGTCLPVDHHQTRRVLDTPDHPLYETVTALHDSAQTMLAARRHAGALAIYDLLRGWATTEDGAPVAVDEAERTIAYVIAQEFMIAANRAVAMWCIERALPILFRTHRRNPVEATAAALTAEFAAAAADPELTGQLRQRLGATVLPARYEAVVGTHHGLRLAAYTHATSPLRRLADLVTQRAVLSHLDGLAPPYTSEQLVLIGDDLDRRIRARKDATTARHKNIAARVVATDSAGDLAALSTTALTKVLKAIRAQPITDGIAAEISARAAADTLTVADWVLLVDTTEPTWREYALTVTPTVAAAHPEWGPSIASGWVQIDPTRPPLDIDTTSSGPAHAPDFTARARFAGISGAPVRTTTKKRAEQDALWSAIEAHLRGVDAPDRDVASSRPPDAVIAADAPADVTTSVTHQRDNPACADSATVTIATVAAQLKPAKKAAALKNPVAWLNSLALTRRIPAPAYDTDSTGPAHTPQFMVTVTFVDLSVHATATTKNAARTAAAAAMVDTLFEHTGRNAP